MESRQVLIADVCNIVQDRSIEDFNILHDRLNDLDDTCMISVLRQQHKACLGNTLLMASITVSKISFVEYLFETCIELEVPIRFDVVNDDNKNIFDLVQESNSFKIAKIFYSRVSKQIQRISASYQNEIRRLCDNICDFPLFSLYCIKRLLGFRFSCTDEVPFLYSLFLGIARFKLKSSNKTTTLFNKSLLDVLEAFSKLEVFLSTSLTLRGYAKGNALHLCVIFNLPEVLYWYTQRYLKGLTEMISRLSEQRNKEHNLTPFMLCGNMHSYFEYVSAKVVFSRLRCIQLFMDNQVDIRQVFVYNNLRGNLLFHCLESSNDVTRRRFSHGPRVPDEVLNFLVNLSMPLPTQKELLRNIYANSIFFNNVRFLLTLWENDTLAKNCIVLNSSLNPSSFVLEVIRLMKAASNSSPALEKTEFQSLRKLLYSLYPIDPPITTSIAFGAYCFHLEEYFVEDVSLDVVYQVFISLKSFKDPIFNFQGKDFLDHVSDVFLLENERESRTISLIDFICLRRRLGEIDFKNIAPEYLLRDLHVILETLSYFNTEDEVDIKGILHYIADKVTPEEEDGSTEMFSAFTQHNCILHTCIINNLPNVFAWYIRYLENIGTDKLREFLEAADPSCHLLTPVLQTVKETKYFEVLRGRPAISRITFILFFNQKKVCFDNLDEYGNDIIDILCEESSFVEETLPILLKMNTNWIYENDFNTFHTIVNSGYSEIIMKLFEQGILGLTGDLYNDGDYDDAIANAVLQNAHCKKFEVFDRTIERQDQYLNDNLELLMQLWDIAIERDRVDVFLGRDILSNLLVYCVFYNLPKFLEPILQRLEKNHANVFLSAKLSIEPMFFCVQPEKNYAISCLELDVSISMLPCLRVLLANGFSASTLDPEEDENLLDTLITGVTSEYSADTILEFVQFLVRDHGLKPNCLIDCVDALIENGNFDVLRLFLEENLIPNLRIYDPDYLYLSILYNAIFLIDATSDEILYRDCTGLECLKRITTLLLEYDFEINGGDIILSKASPQYIEWLLNELEPRHIANIGTAITKSVNWPSNYCIFILFIMYGVKQDRRTFLHTCSYYPSVHRSYCRESLEDVEHCYICSQASPIHLRCKCGKNICHACCFISHASNETKPAFGAIQMAERRRDAKFSNLLLWTKFFPEYAEYMVRNNLNRMSVFALVNAKIDSSILASVLDEKKLSQLGLSREDDRI